MKIQPDIFISYSSKDVSIANGICDYLEKNGHRCWIAPRDVPGGRPYAVEIVEAIKICRVMLLIFSKNTNNSKHVANEINVAFNNNKIILTYKIQDIAFDDSFEYYLGSQHWIIAAANPRTSFENVLIQINTLVGPGKGNGGEGGGNGEGGKGNDGRGNGNDGRGNVDPNPFKYKYLVAILVVVIMVVLYLLFKPAHLIVVKDLVVFDDFTDSHSSDNDSRLNSAILIYLITDRVLQTSVKNVLTSDEFSIVYGKERIPELKISGQLISRNIGYSIKIKFKHAYGKTADEVFDFADPAALLDPNKGIIPGIAENIIESNSGKSMTRSYTFTSSWDAFEEFYQGEMAWQKLDITNAERHYKNALTYDNQFTLTKLRYAQLLNFNGYDLEAKEIIREIKPQIGQLSWLDSLKTEALEARLSGDFFEENNILKNIYNRYPTRKECAYEVAESYYAKCDVENAIIYYQNALTLDQNFALAHNHIGYCYSHKGEHSEALRHFKIYLSLDSTANSYDSYGDGFMAAGKSDSAEWAKKQGIIRDSNLYYLWGSLGLIDLRQGKFVEADHNFQQYINLAIGNKAKAGGYFRKALIPFYEGKYNDALKLCLFARNLYDTTDIGTRDHEMHWLLGYIYLLLKEPGKAKAELAFMKNLADANKISATNYQMDFYKFRLHLEIAMNAYNSDLTNMLTGMAEFDGAIKNKIKDHTSTFDLAFFNTSFGELLLWPQISKPELAEKRFLQALDYNPNYALAHYNLWKLYLREGKNELAHLHLLKFKDIWKNADREVIQKYGI